MLCNYLALYVAREYYEIKNSILSTLRNALAMIISDLIMLSQVIKSWMREAPDAFDFFF